jgi:hypothetical protein
MGIRPANAQDCAASAAAAGQFLTKEAVMCRIPASMLPSYRLMSEEISSSSRNSISSSSSSRMEEEEKEDRVCFCGLQGMFRCSKCRAKHYCSAEHQRSDWKEHKKVCVSAPLIRDLDEDGDGDEGCVDLDPLLPLILSDALLSSTAAALSVLAGRLGELSKESK